MSSKNNGLSVSHGTVLSVVCLLLYSAGFIRIELKFNDHDQRLMAVEEVISQVKRGMVHTCNSGKVSIGVSRNLNLVLFSNSLIYLIIILGILPSLNRKVFSELVTKYPGSL